MSEKEEIGKDEFQKLLIEKGFVFNKTVVEEIEIDLKKLNLTRNQFGFNDIVFKEKITLKNYEYPCKIFIKKCTISDRFSIDKFQIELIQLHKTDYKFFTIDNSECREIQFIESNGLPEGRVIIRNVLKVERLVFQEDNPININLQKSEIKEFYNYSQLDFNSRVNINVSSCTIGEVKILGMGIGRVHVAQSNINFFQLFAVTVHNEVSLIKNTFKNGLLSSTEYGLFNIFQFNENNIDKFEIHIPPSIIEEKNIKFERSLEINENIINQSLIIRSYNKSIFKDIHYQSNLKSQGLVQFELTESLIKKITLKGLNNDRIFIRNIDIEQLIFESFENINYSQFSNANFRNLEDQKSQIICKTSDLSNVYLKNCRFHDTQFLYDNTILKDLKLSNSPLSKVTFELLNKRDNVFDHIQLRELYSQLKTVMLNNGDKVNELIFKGEELNEQLNILRKEKIKYADQFVLAISKLTNDFGRSWVRPLWQIAVWNIIFCFLLSTCIELNPFVIEPSFQFDLFLKLFNPTHSSDTLYYSTNGYLTIDFISRIVNSIYIFQLIMAFRKYWK